MNEYLRELRQKGEKKPEGWFVSYEPVKNLPGDIETADTARGKFTQKYSWAIPDDKAIETLVEYDPLLEVGAGNGYWAHLVEEAGGDIVATDKEPWSDTWTEVVQRDHTIVREPGPRTLFMCWPAYAEAWTGEALEMYDGDTFIYVGEGHGGCTGDAKFHEVLDKEFGPAVETVEIPQWYGIHDKMFIFER